MGRNQVNAFMIDYGNYIPNFELKSVSVTFQDYKGVRFQYLPDMCPFLLERVRPILFYSYSPC